MSAKMDQVCESLRGRLNTAEERLKSVRTNIHALASIDEAELAILDADEAQPPASAAH